MASPMPSSTRRALLIGAPALLLAGCGEGMPVTVSRTPKIEQDRLREAVAEIAADARPAALGVGLMNLESGESFLFNGERRFPMQSVFKLPLGAAVLSEVDLGRVLLSEPIYLTEQQLSPQVSAIATAFPTKREYTVGQLLDATVIDSDNTAADVLMKRIGGPGALTAWLTSKKVPDVRVDRYERELQPQANGMPTFRPEWRLDAAWNAARDKVPAAERLAAKRAYMADPRDTATPRGMIDFLQKLHRRDLLSPGSTQRLLDMMGRTLRGAGRLRAGLPNDAFLAHRPGTAGFDQRISAAHNDVGILTLEDRRAYAIAVFLSGSPLEDAPRDAIVARVARAVVRAIR